MSYIRVYIFLYEVILCWLKSMIRVKNNNFKELLYYVRTII